MGVGRAPTDKPFHGPCNSRLPLASRVPGARRKTRETVEPYRQGHYPFASGASGTGRISRASTEPRPPSHQRPLHQRSYSDLIPVEVEKAHEASLRPPKPNPEPVGSTPSGQREGNPPLSVGGFAQPRRPAELRRQTTVPGKWPSSTSGQTATTTDESQERHGQAQRRRSSEDPRGSHTRLQERNGIEREVRRRPATVGGHGHGHEQEQGAPEYEQPARAERRRQKICVHTHHHHYWLRSRSRPQSAELRVRPGEGADAAPLGHARVPDGSLPRREQRRSSDSDFLVTAATIRGGDKFDRGGNSTSGLPRTTAWFPPHSATEKLAEFRARSGDTRDRYYVHSRYEKIPCDSATNISNSSERPLAGGKESGSFTRERSYGGGDGKGGIRGGGTSSTRDRRGRGYDVSNDIARHDKGKASFSRMRDKDFKGRPEERGEAGDEIGNNSNSTARLASLSRERRGGYREELERRDSRRRGNGRHLQTSAPEPRHDARPDHTASSSHTGRAYGDSDTWRSEDRRDMGPRQEDDGAACKQWPSVYGRSRDQGRRASSDDKHLLRQRSEHNPPGKQPGHRPSKEPESHSCKENAVEWRARSSERRQRERRGRGDGKGEGTPAHPPEEARGRDPEADTGATSAATTTPTITTPTGTPATPPAVPPSAGRDGTANVHEKRQQQCIITIPTQTTSISPKREGLCRGDDEPTTPIPSSRYGSPADTGTTAGRGRTSNSDTTPTASTTATTTTPTANGSRRPRPRRSFTAPDPYRPSIQNRYAASSPTPGRGGSRRSSSKGGPETERRQRHRQHHRKRDGRDC